MAKRKMRRKNIDNVEITDIQQIVSENIIIECGQQVQKMTGKQHADRILSLGSYRAKSLMKMHQLGNNWGHVDWKYLEENLN